MAAQNETDYVLVRMPAKLKAKIRSDAFKTNTNMTARINAILGAHYSVDVPKTSRRSAPFGGGSAGDR